MIPNDRIDSLLQQLKQALPNGNLSNEVEKNMRALVQSAFSKLDIVTREEFEAQAAVLQRSREKIEQLEKQLAELAASIEQP